MDQVVAPGRRGPVRRRRVQEAASTSSAYRSSAIRTAVRRWLPGGAGPAPALVYRKMRRCGSGSAVSRTPLARSRTPSRRPAAPRRFRSPGPRCPRRLRLRRPRPRPRRSRRRRSRHPRPLRVSGAGSVRHRYHPPVAVLQRPVLDAFQRLQEAVRHRPHGAVAEHLLGAAVAQRAEEGHPGGRAGAERLHGIVEHLFHRHRALLHRHALLGGQLQDGAPRDAGQDGVAERRRHQAAVAEHEEQVAGGTLLHVAVVLGVQEYTFQVAGTSASRLASALVT